MKHACTFAIAKDGCVVYAYLKWPAYAIKHCWKKEAVCECVSVKHACAFIITQGVCVREYECVSTCVFYLVCLRDLSWWKDAMYVCQPICLCFSVSKKGSTFQHDYIRRPRSYFCVYVFLKACTKEVSCVSVYWKDLTGLFVVMHRPWQKLYFCVDVSACVCTHWGLWGCGCMRLNVSRAESVPACVCACLESGIFLHLSRADQVSLYVGHYQELSMCACFQSNVICCERNTDTTAICRNRIQLSKQDKYTWISINMYMYVYVYMFAKYLWKCDEDHPNDGKVMYACLCTWVPFQVLI
jgi:hypothetical protein